MKSRITKKLRILRQTGKKAFIPFITAGDPNLKTTEKLIHTLEKAGATLIELGVPFTDPMADGPTIQRANERSLKKGANLSGILSLVKNVRKTSQIPILLMGYYNPILQYGLEKFCQDANMSGIDGVLIVDLPAEEASEMRKVLKKYPIDLIYLLTPTSNGTRINKINKYGSGFIYYVSLTGITGAKHINTKDVNKHIKFIRNQVKLPINIGFGISKPQHVRALSPMADGVVVGSAIVKLIEKYGRSKSLHTKVARYVKSLVNAL